ncbi:MAG: ATP-binding protein [Deltaproteobacteria bacterium]|nr:ATP-binding protein [Deltaproteobacteria bacterium]
MSLNSLKSEEQKESIERFLKVILPIVVALGLVFLFFDLRRLGGNYRSLEFLFYSLTVFGLLLSYFFRKYIPSHINFLFIVFLLFFVSAFSLIWYGFEMKSTLALSHICILLFFVFGPKIGYLSLSFGAAIIVLKGILLDMGYTSVSPVFLKRLPTFEMWALVAFAFFFYPFPVLFFIAQAKEKLEKKINELYEVNRKLKEEIIKRQISEKKAAELEDMYRSMIRSSVAGFFFLDGTKFIFANRKTCEILGVDETEIVTKDFVEFIHPEDVNHIFPFFAKGFPLSEKTLRCISKDGKELFVLFSIVPILYGEKNLYSGVMIDVTREKKLESELIHAQKMEAVGVLTQGISHDFNNVLTAIVGYASLMKERLEKDDPLRIYTERIVSSCEKAQAIIKDLLIFGRKDPLMMKEIDLNEVIKDSEGLLRRLFTRDTHMELHLSDEKLTVMCDPVKIQQVLMNLATNARDAMTERKIVVIKVKPFEIDDDFIRDNGFGNKGKYALISFSDTGSGIKDDVKNHIFEPFFTTKEKGKGTGLGLSVAYSIIKQHNGYIRVESTFGVGTTFYIYLPLVEEKIKKFEA